MRYLVYIVLLSLAISSSGQTSTIDSLKGRIESHSITDTLYVDLVNELAFELLLVEPSEANHWISKGAYLSDSLNYKKGIIRSLINKGSSYWIIGFFNHALENYLLALEKGADPGSYVILCNNIGEVFKKKKQYNSALQYYFRGLEKAKAFQGIGFELIPSNIAETYFLMGKYDSAEYYHRLSYEEAQKTKNLRNMSYALFGLGEIAFQKRNLTEAISHYQSALALRQKINDKRGIIQSLNKLGTYYGAQNETKRAIDYFTKAEILSKQFGASDLLINCYKLKADIYYKTGPLKKSIGYLNKYVQLKDSIAEITLTDNLNNLQAALKARIKEEQNQLVIQQKEKAQKLLKAQSLLIVIILSIAIMLVLLLFRYFKSLKAARKTSKDLDLLNKVILSKNQKIKEINNQLDKQLLSTNKLLAEIEKLSKLGGWDYDLLKGEMYWTDEIYRQLDLPKGTSKPSLQLLKKAIDKTEYHKIQLAYKYLQKDKKAQTINIFIKSGNKERIISIKMIPELSNGEIVRIYGSNHDITEILNHEKKEVAILQCLFHFSQKSNLTRINFQTFIQGILQESILTLEIDRAGFWWYDEKNNRTTSYCQCDHEIVRFENNEVRHESQYPKYFQAVKSKRTIVANDALSDPRTAQLGKGYLNKHHIKSLLETPLVLDGKIVGIISFEKNNTPVTWTYSDQRFAGTIAELIANAFNISQNRILEKEKEKLISKLVKRNQNLKEFAYVVSHNLRDPVTQILGLSTAYGEAEGEEMTKEIIPKIRRSAKNLDKVIRDLSVVLRQQEESKEETQQISLMESLEIAMTNVQSEIDKVKPVINFNFDTKFTLSIQPSVLYNIVYNLLSNAIKYRSADRPLEITISAIKNEDEITLSFEDNGLGIDLDLFGDKIFKMYERFHLDIEGNGLGLYLVKNQVENRGGTIQVESTPEHGAKFIIKLPVIPNQSLSDESEQGIHWQFIR